MAKQTINFTILIALFFLNPIISNAQICWQQVSTINDYYIRVVKTATGNYLCNTTNPPGGAAVNFLYESNDLINWTPTSISFPSQAHLGFNVNTEGKLYLATAHNGVYQSLDNGSSWSYNFASGYGCGSLDIEFDNSHGTYVGVGGQCRGLHVSTDDGASWTNKIPGMDFTDIQFIASTNQVYACNNNFGVFVSNDNGTTWSQITSQPFSSSTCMIKYWQGKILIFENTGAVYSSNDAGTSWNLEYTLPFTANATAYGNDAVFIDDNIAYTSFYLGEIYRTEDGGQTWNSASNCLSGEIHYMFYDGGILLVTTSDGIYAYSECNIPATVSTNDSTTFCEGGDASLTANAGSGYQYQWQLNGVDIVGANSDTLVVNSAGDYTVVIQSGLNCSSTSSLIHIETLQNQNYFSDTDADGFGDGANVNINCIQPIGYVSDNTDCDDTNALVNPNAVEIGGNGIDENCDGQIDNSIEEFSATISLFPNPATTEINLQTTNDLIGSDLIIFDALGKQIHKQQILSTNTRINTSAFAAGNYVVKVGGVVKRVEVKK
jgi:photosystem II stability/assembly factor-like uncharacterized protein